MCSMRMWADDDIERNITSSDVEFLEGGEISDKTSKEKDKPASVDKGNTTPPDLSGIGHRDKDVDMHDSDIMSVFDQNNR